MNIRKEDLINAREAFRPQIKPKLAPQVDIELSKVAGKTILANDPRLLNLIVEFKKKQRRVAEEHIDRNGKKYLIESQDNFMQNPEFIKKLKEL